MQINEAFALLVLRSKKTYLCTMYIKQYERVERRFKVTHLPQDDGGSKVLLQTTQMGSDNIPNTLRSAEHPPAPIRTITITHRGSRCCTHGCSRLRSRTARFRRQGMEGKGYPSKVWTINAKTQRMTRAAVSTACHGCSQPYMREG